MNRSDQAAYFRLRRDGYELAAEVAEELDALGGDDAQLARECEPTIRVAESDVSGSTYVYLDGVRSRISDHAAMSGDQNERLSAAKMVVRWIYAMREEMA